MAERRSLTAAVSTSVPGVEAEIVRSFVTQNQNAERPITAPVTNIGGSEVTRQPESVKIESTESRPIRTKPKKASRFQPVGLIPVTIRLKPEIAGGLKRASLELELEGEEVFTQQELVENALEPWLRQNGFLS